MKNCEEFTLFKQFMIGSNYNQTLFERSVSLYYKVSEIAQLNFSGGEFVISVIVSVCTIVSV